MKRAALFIILFSALSILFAALPLSAAHADDQLSTEGSREPASAKPRKDPVAKQIDAAFPTPAPTPQPYVSKPPREFDRAIDMETPPEPSGFGIQLQIYYDPLSTYAKFNPTGVQGQYSYQNQTGLAGMQLMFARINRAHFEFTSGIDYTFTQTVQGQQSVPIGNYLVNSQTLSLVGVKIAQIGYRFGAGPFTIVPYLGLGFYYGRNTVTVANLGFASQTDTVTYTKLFGTVVAGGRLDFDFNKARTLAAGVALEMFAPYKISDSLSQSGSASVIQAGFEPNLQNSLDFMTTVSGRVMGSLAFYF